MNAGEFKRDHSDDETVFRFDFVRAIFLERGL
jgi:hypothetical protein